MKFSIGYNNDIEGFLRIMKRHHDKIKSIYFPLPQEYMGSGRAPIKKPAEKYQQEINLLLKLATKLKITPILLLNSTIINYTKIQKVLKVLKTLYEKKLIRHVVLTDPYLMTRIKKNFPDIIIEISILAHVRTIQEAKYYKDIGANIITIDREKIRNIPFITKISQIIKPKILVNEGCLKNCIYRYSHYNNLCLASSMKNYKLDYFRSYSIDKMCLITVSKYPQKIFSSPFIRPEDLKFYSHLNLDYKISSRNWSSNQLEEALVAYYTQNYKGNLINLLNTTLLCMIDSIDNKKLDNYEFFKKLSSCDDNCDKCEFCKNLLLETTKIKKECLECNLFNVKQNIKKINLPISIFTKNKNTQICPLSSYKTVLS